jgi:hypothetical protein
MPNTLEVCLLEQTRFAAERVTDLRKSLPINALQITKTASP